MTACDNSSSKEKDPIDKGIEIHERLPVKFEASVIFNEKPLKIKMHKFSLRRKDTRFFVFSPDDGNNIKPLGYVPEVRSYRGQVEGQPTSMIIGYIDGNNQFYGRVYHGGQVAWEIKDLTVVTNDISSNTDNPAMQRSPADLQTITDNYKIPAPSLASPVLSDDKFHMQLAEGMFVASFDSYKLIFKHNLESAIGAMDYSANAIDHLFARDSLIRFRLVGGLIVQTANGLNQSGKGSALRKALSGSGNAQIFHTFTGPKFSGSASGLGSECEFNKSMWCTLHEIGHSFNLGHSVGPETVGLMATTEAIPTNNISVMKSSRGATSGRISPAMDSRVSPNANIDHLDVKRNSTKEIDLFVNDFDANGPKTGGTIKLTNLPRYSRKLGQIEHVSDGVIRYTAPDGYVGEDEFSYSIIDDQGMGDSTDVHIRVVAEARVAYYSLADYKIRPDGQDDKAGRTELRHLTNKAGDDHFIIQQIYTKWPNNSVGILQSTSTEKPGSYVFTENKTMALQQYHPHSLVPGSESYSIALKFKQDGDFVPKNSDDSLINISQEIAMVGQGKLDAGFALSYFNGNANRMNYAGEPAKGLGWTLVGRQFFTQQNYEQQPHTVHAYADPSAVTLNDNIEHDVVWVINRDTNTVTTWVDGKKIPMKLKGNDTLYEDVPLPDGFVGSYPSGTNSWYSYGRTWYSSYYGPWFERTTNDAAGTDIWVQLTNFTDQKTKTDHIQSFTYALSEADIARLQKGQQPAYTNSPVNGTTQNWTDLTLNWDNKNATAYRLRWGYNADVSTMKTIDMGMKKHTVINPDTNQKVLYWSVDSKIADKWISGNIWSVLNRDKVGRRLSVSFDGPEVNVATDQPWPKDFSGHIDDVLVTAEQKKGTNKTGSHSLYGNGSNLVFATEQGENIHEVSFSMTEADNRIKGQFNVQYLSGSTWKDMLVLYKDGVHTNDQVNGILTSRPGVSDTDFAVILPESASSVRFIVTGDENVAVWLNHVDIMIN